MSVDYRRSHVYAAEHEAFRGTTLDEELPHTELVQITEQVLGSTWWGDVGGRPLVVAVSQYSDCSYWQRVTATVAYTDTAGRYTVAHELAHALHDFNVDVLSRAAHRPHGAQWRGWYVVVVHAMYGTRFADLLVDAYARYNLPIELPFAVVPPVPLCQFELPAPSVGGWKRFR